MVRRLSLSLSILLLVGACAGSPSAPTQADQQAKRFDQPPPDTGAVYVYRSGPVGHDAADRCQLAGGAPAQLGYNTFIRVEGPPGPVDIACKVGDNTANGRSRSRTARRASSRWRCVPGWTPSCEVAEVPPDQGQAAVRSSRRVEPI